MRESFKKLLYKHPISVRAILIAFAFEVFMGLVSVLVNDDSVFYSSIFIALFLVCPIVLSVINIVSVFTTDTKWNLKIFEWIGIVLGGLYTILYMGIMDVTSEDWWKVIYVVELHTPVLNSAKPTLIAIVLIAFVGYAILSFKSVEKLPPLVTVLSISAMYLGCAVAIVWCVQTFSKGWILSVYPINCILLVIKRIKTAVISWSKSEREYNGICGKIIRSSVFLPVAALVVAVPLLGIVLCILVLFGQQPDYIIKAWTETADWTLSQQVAPPPLEPEGHYLCTVAANGHRKVVKPLRMGQRRGEKIVVNRQLCIANAFEQIIEEKTPKFHRFIRNTYDKYGFPIAMLIKTKFAADVVYILMKPLEWMFLVVIYMCDVKPENRIAVQYLPKNR
jgi:hypothetical protein